MRHLLLPLLLHILNANLSLQDELAARTTTSDTASNYDLAPSPTVGACDLNGCELRRRADSVPPNICGWFSGSGYGKCTLFARPNSQLPKLPLLIQLRILLDGRWSYYNPIVTCFWNSDAKIIGNGVPPHTQCVDSAQLSTWSCSTCSGSVLEWYVCISYLNSLLM
jgi:hypothetical protein